MAIVLEELARLGVSTVVRVGSSGPADRSVRPGDLVVTLGAGRFDGTSAAYAPVGFPAVSDPEVVRVLAKSAQARSVRFHVGLTASVDGFYLEPGRRGYGGYRTAPGRSAVPELRPLGFLNVEMECATLLTVARLYGLRAGAVLAVYDESRDRTPRPRGDAEAIAVASDALALL